MLRLEGVSKTYRVGSFGGRELAAVRDVDLEVGPRGALYVLVFGQPGRVLRIRFTG